jgi:hypothetical protein
VSDTTLSPTVRPGVGVITALDRAAGKATLAAAWNSTFTGGIDGDSIIRAGDAAVGGENTVPAGCARGSRAVLPPGTWKGLTRNDDPVRLASQVLDMTGLPMAEAIIDLESLIQIQGHEPKLKLVCNPRDFRQVKKTLYGKVAFTSGGGTPTIGFDGANWQGNSGMISTLISPVLPKEQRHAQAHGPLRALQRGSCSDADELRQGEHDHARDGRRRRGPHRSSTATSARALRSSRHAARAGGTSEMDGLITQPIDSLGNEPRILWGSFQCNGTSNPDSTKFRYPPGMKFTAVYSATGVVTVTLPVGCGTPGQPATVVASAQFAVLATDYFEVAVLGETTLNTGARQIVFQMKRAGTGQAPAATAGNRVNFAIFFNNSTGA